MDYRDRLSVVLLVVTLLSCPNHLDCTSMATVVVPGNFTDACPQEHCSTINDLPSSIFNNSIQLYFLSGQHLLQRHISMHDVSSGHVQISSSCSSPQCNPTILCQGGPTGMSFQNIQTVEIAGLTFSGCTHQGEVGFGGAISFINVTNISIVNCHFVGNHITGNIGGGALYVSQSQSVSIRNSSFVNNYAYLSIHQCSGAAFFQNNNFVLIQHTLFKNNTATSGGAIFADQTDLTLHQSSFFQNNATDSGGAVDTLNSLIVIIESEFESNLAILASVINARNTTISILSSSFLNNTAVSTGCIYIQDGSVVRSNNSAYSDNVGSVYIIIKSSSFFVNNTFVNNQVGGVLVGSSCSFIGIDNAFINNSASNTNIYMTSCNSSFLRNHFIKNGAAGNYYDMLFQYGSLSMSETTYAGNFTSGAIIVASVSTAFFADSSFKRNKLKSTQQIGSAISVVGNVNLTVLRSNFSDNQAAFGGGTIALIGATVDIKPVRILISDCYFFNNNAAYGGAIYFTSTGTDSECIIRHSSFVNNTADYGGAIFMLSSTFTKIRSCLFRHNVAKYWGGAVNIRRGQVKTFDSRFLENFADEYGGAIAIKGDITTTQCEYIGNAANERGGAIYILNGNLNTSNSLFAYNKGSQFGGAIFSNRSSVAISNTTFYFNKASLGGATHHFASKISCRETSFTNNTSDEFGGAVYIQSGSHSSQNTQYKLNNASEAGGAIFALSSNLLSSMDTYQGNMANKYGGAVYIDSCFSVSTHFNETGNNLITSIILFGEPVCSKFKDYLLSREPNWLQINGGSLFLDNWCSLAGGAVVAIHTQVYVSGDGRTIIRGNSATHGAGLALVWSNVSISCPTQVTNNQASISGGGIYMYDSNIIIFFGTTIVVIEGNIATKSGGGIYSSKSKIEVIGGKMCFSKNNATYGGALYSIDTKLNIVKQEENETSKILFTENSAVQGGAIYVMDVIQDCETRYNARKECFLQTLLNRSNVTRVANNYFNVYFINNTASLSSNAIFGGLLDRCSLNPANKLLLDFPNQTFLSGADYILATAQFAGLIDYSNLTTNYNPEKVLQAVSGAIVNNFISSEPLQVCYCFGYQPNCSDFQHAPVYVKKGQLFSISVIAVDQVGNPVNATVISSVVTGSRLLNSNKALQRIPAECSLLEYSLYPDQSDPTADIELFASGPCNNIGVSKRTLNVIFQPCICPIGFQQRETRTQCLCECDTVLQSYITSCSPENETVLRRPNVWIDYVNTSTKSGYLLYPNCPFDYCVDELVSVNLNTAHGADSQCVFNRTGTLCGACKKNLSAVLGSSQCRECTNSYISLLIPFAMAGIALVAFVVLFNLTVTTGTINGLIFYANMIFANRSLFVPSGTPGLLRIFISWLNLDLGIETCFFNGMDSYAKVLLQLVFPSYILILTVLIIMLCEYSVRFSTFIGKKRDPVGTLCTLILLSYSKFIRTIIASLQHAYLNYPDGSSETVWLYDANVPYFKPSHAPRFITVSVIIILGLVYTVLLLFGQWLTKLGRWIPFRWVNNPKYNEFIVKYHTQLKPKHRYWVGLLLLVRISYYTVSAFVSQSAALLSLILIVLILLSLKHISSHVYEVNAIDNLESAFLVNLGVLAACLYFLQDSEGIPHIAASISITVSAFLFIVIFGYHAHTFILKNTRLWISIIALLRPVWVRMRGLVQCPNLRRNADIDLQEEEIEHEENQLLLQELPYAQGESDDEEQHPYEAPIIQPAVRDSQPRNQDLEQLFQPITARDYRRFQEPVRPQQPTTYSVVEID